MKVDFASTFKNDNAGKWAWYNGAMGLTDCLLNDYIEDSYESAVLGMANRDGVSIEEVENNYKNWYCILPVEEIEDEYLNDYAEEYLTELEEGYWQRVG